MDSKTFHILLVLAGGPLHGYAIRREVEERTGGSLKLWPATLYGALRELTESGWIEEVAGAATEEDPRRRTFGLTAHGRRALAAEAGRLEELARLARGKLAEGPA